MKKLKQQFVPLVLVLSIVVSTISPLSNKSVVYAKESHQNKEVFVLDETEYITYASDDLSTVTVVNTENNDKVTIEYDGKTLTVYKNDYKGKSWFGKDKYDLKISEVEIAESAKELDEKAVSSQGYAKAVSTYIVNGKGNDYWYMMQ